MMCRMTPILPPQVVMQTVSPLWDIFMSFDWTKYFPLGGWVSAFIGAWVGIVAALRYRHDKAAESARNASRPQFEGVGGIASYIKFGRDEVYPLASGLQEHVERRATMVVRNTAPIGIQISPSYLMLNEPGHEGQSFATVTFSVIEGNLGRPNQVTLSLAPFQEVLCEIIVNFTRVKEQPANINPQVAVFTKTLTHEHVPRSGSEGELTLSVSNQDDPVTLHVTF